MNTIRSPITSSILAIDLGKYKSVVCVYEPSSAAARFVAIDTSLDHRHHLDEFPGATAPRAWL